MNMRYLSVFIVTILAITACSRSKDSTYYVLTPLTPVLQTTALTGLNIGIDEVQIPAYLEKNDLAINITSHQLALEEYNQWAEPLSKNIPRILRTNLSGLLKGAVVQISPWDSKFKPDYQLQVFITQMTMDLTGKSTLRAEYLIYKDNQLIRKKIVQYQNKILPTTHENSVIAMNSNVNRLSMDIAQHLRR